MVPVDASVVDRIRLVVANNPPGKSRSVTSMDVASSKVEGTMAGLPSVTTKL